ncbi:hypothetical protein EDF60_2722 [Leucobacter luti]|uniref:hypothetical protein n=1 Tax=Leucobacter luti TaxID=340320 RepID=UPI001046F649|nr:hypothetical protein [Leucobacter luti]MCW2289845.1 hypothetical protein [Leucobacter luti]TCK36014.1 hypothetical protein EDF60_2722 [Leucobacter luti]
MTRRKRAVAALVILQLLLIGLSFVFLSGRFPLLAIACVGAAIGVLTLALVFVWRRLAMQHAALREEITVLAARPVADRSKTAPSAAQPQRPNQSAESFLVGRAAGARQAVSTSYAEQESQLFGPGTAWQSLAEDDLSSERLAVLGRPPHYASLPSVWHGATELLPGVLEAQAVDSMPGVVLCTSGVFSEAPWREAIDASGTWLMQDLQRLREWADAHGATLVFFDHGDLPLGVNTIALPALFHVVIDSSSPHDGPEGAPTPAPLTSLYRCFAQISARLAAEGAR